MKQSQLIDELIRAFQRLPSIGPKSAARITYHLLERGRPIGLALAEALDAAMTKLNHCQSCRMFTEHDLCDICADKSRNPEQLCVVEAPSDLNAIESSGAYRGYYFVLMGRLSPLDGIGPAELGLDALVERFASVKELLIATNSTVEGEATAHYIQTLADEHDLVVTRLASGIPLGGELDYIDTHTLARAIEARQQLGKSF